MTNWVPFSCDCPYLDTADGTVKWSRLVTGQIDLDNTEETLFYLRCYNQQFYAQSTWHSDCNLTGGIAHESLSGEGTLIESKISGCLIVVTTPPKRFDSWYHSSGFGKYGIVIPKAGDTFYEHQFINTAKCFINLVPIICNPLYYCLQQGCVANITTYQQLVYPGLNLVINGVPSNLPWPPT